MKLFYHIKVILPTPKRKNLSRQKELLTLSPQRDMQTV